MKKRKIIEILLIIILGFIPLLWFQGNQVILGHDAGLTLSPISHFFDRLFSWTERFGFGNNQTYAIAGFFIHGLEALIASLGFSLQNVQKIVFIFWLVLPGLTMYYFSSRLSDKLNLKYFALPASILYMLNHFLLQGWFVAERTKFSVYAALPLIMAFLFDWEGKKRSAFKTALLIALTLSILNGEASLPLFGGLILSFLTFIIFYFIREFSLQRILEIVKLLATIFIVIAFLNTYWLLPYGRYILQSYSSAVAQAGGLDGVLGWLNYISRESSLINIFRLQGIPEWYLNSSHPYANIFLNNAFLIAVGFLIPIAAFLPFFLIKNKESRKKIIFFSFLALFSMIFIAGSHPPFGAIYVFLINVVPGFIAFRNPFYKFAPALWFSYAILISFTINYLLQKVELNKKIFSYIFYFAICIGIILYSFPFLNGSFFDYIKGERSMKVVVPQYIFDFGKWSESKDRINVKTLALPPPNSENKVDAYTWGYWSLSPLTSLLTNAPIINESNYMSGSEIRLIETLYKMMKNNEPGWQNLARLLGIESFLLRKDFVWNLRGSPTDKSSDYEEALNEQSLVLVKKFGEWEVYDLKDVDIPNVKSYSQVNYLVGDVTDLGKVSTLLDFKPEEPIYVSGTVSDDSQQILSMRNRLFLVPACVSCNLQHKFINIDLFVPLITRDSMIYFLVEFKNNLTEKKLISIPEKINYYLYKSLRNILALDKLISQKKDLGILKAEIEDYGKSLKNLNESLFVYLSSIENIDNNFLLELYDVLRIEKTIIIRNSNDISDKEIIDLLNEKYAFLEKLREKIDKDMWRTTDETSKKFLVVSNLDEQFNLFYRPNFVNTSSTISTLTIDGKGYEIEAKPVSSGWISLGEFYLSKGLHKLNVKQPTENLYLGPTSVQLNSSPSFSCFSSNKIKADKNDVYRISFQHKRLSGSKKFFTKILPGEVKPNPLDKTGDVLDSMSVWDNYTVERESREDGFFYLTICNPPGIDKEDFISSIELRNINIRRITVPDVILYNASSVENKVEIKNEFSKKSQTQYLVPAQSTEGKKIITLKESYDENWNIDGANKDIKFTVNGYANGWIVKNNQNIIIKYKLQDFTKIGFALSGISFIICLIFLLLRFKKNE